jgi:hypothetical protein
MKRRAPYHDQHFFHRPTEKRAPPAMSTLIAVYNSSGRVGRCDANCYNAHTAACDCVCGGANHAKGFNAAALQTQTAAQQMAEAFAAANPEMKIETYRTNGKSHALRQRQLF